MRSCLYLRTQLKSNSCVNSLIIYQSRKCLENNGTEESETHILCQTPFQFSLMVSEKTKQRIFTCKTGGEHPHCTYEFHTVLFKYILLLQNIIRIIFVVYVNKIRFLGGGIFKMLCRCEGFRPRIYSQLYRRLRFCPL